MNIRSTMRRGIATTAVVAMSLALGAPAWAGYKLAFTEDKYINVGIGLRTSFQADGANGDSWDKKFKAENVRLYTNGKVLPMLSFEVNFD
ncbi:MAG: hypothetical protein VCC02_04165, partial [Myxococcota bacterium]